MKRRLLTWAFALSFVSLPAVAQEEAAEEAEETAPRRSLTLAPGAPRTGALPGGISAGVESMGAEDWRFDFHGFMNMPLRVGIGERENPTEGQSGTTLHTPPVVPGEYGSFSYTNVMAPPWVQLNFNYGTSVIGATVIVAAKTAQQAASFYNPPDHLGINDVFLTFNLPISPKVYLNWYVGAFQSRYGVMGEYDEGWYATPLVARLSGVGETLSARIKLNEKTHLLLEHGVLGSLDKPPLGFTPDGWNGFKDENIGSTLATHLHAGVSWNRFLNVTGHGIIAITQDDQAAVQTQPDARMAIVGGEARLTMEKYGHLFVGGSYADAENVRSMGRVVQYLNTEGGLGLMRNYLGMQSGGNGSITAIGGQYDLAIAPLVVDPQTFKGNAPDVRVSLFGMYVRTNTEDTERRFFNRRDICSLDCLKFGGEAAYGFTSWMAASLRADRVSPNTADSEESTTIVSPRLIFRSDYNAQDQVVLQYSRYFYGGDVVARSPGYNPDDLTYREADENAVSLSATMWW